MRAPECSQDSAGIGLTLSFQEACADSNSPEHWNSNLGKPQTRRTIGITRLCYPKDTSVTILAVFAARAHLWRGAASHAAGGAKGRVTCHKCRRDLPAKTGIVSWQAPLPSAALRSQAVISAASRFVLFPHPALEFVPGECIRPASLLVAARKHPCTPLWAARR